MDNGIMGLNPKMLGFGLMRLPGEDGGIDLAATQKMIDTFIAEGGTYFDTAYVYYNGESERTFKKLIADRYPRDKYTIATKMPLWGTDTPERLEQIFAEQIENTGAGFFDFYLIHAITSGNSAVADKVDVWGFLSRKKQEGFIKHIGFSFHASPELLDEVLTAHPEMEFVQLQINYADWNDPKIRARECYEVARKHGKPIIIMEPLKGGSIANLTEGTRAMLNAATPGYTPANWALRFACGLDGVMTVLSGMSNQEQMEQNLEFMDRCQPLSESEKSTLAAVVDELNKVDTIPCTSCKYCVDGCPANIQIPRLFSTYNDYQVFNFMPGVAYAYSDATGKAKISDCIECGVCEEHCPQSIEIRDMLKKVEKTFTV